MMGESTKLVAPSMIEHGLARPVPRTAERETSKWIWFLFLLPSFPPLPHIYFGIPN